MPNKQKESNAADFRHISAPKTALYCRSARQSDHAIGTQKEWLMRFANQTGHTNLKWYIDNGGDGLTLNRPAMNTLMEDIESGTVATVAVTSVDRISRSLVVLAEWMRFLDTHDVRYCAVDSGEND